MIMKSLKDGQQQLIELFIQSVLGKGTKETNHDTTPPSNGAQEESLSSAANQNTLVKSVMGTGLPRVMFLRKEAISHKEDLDKQQV